MKAADFEWSDLRFFLAVARSGKLIAAAQALAVEHSTVSRRIAALERALGAKLFDRRPAGFALTAQGELLLRSAEAMESLALGALGDIAGADMGISGSVRIGAPDGFGSMFLAPRLGAFSALHPGLEIQLLAMPRTFSLSKREADIAISLSRPKEGRLHARKLTDYRLRLYASRDYVARHGPITAPGDLPRHPFIGYIDDLIYAPELDYVPLISRDLKARLKSSNLIAQMMATRAGAGVCVLPCFMGDGQDDLVPILPQEVSLTRTFYLITHTDMRDLARVRAAADFIAGQVSEAKARFLPMVF